MIAELMSKVTELTKQFGSFLGGITAAGNALLTAPTTAAQRTVLGLGDADSPTFNDLFVNGLLTFTDAQGNLVSCVSIEATGPCTFFDALNLSDGSAVRGNVRWGLGVSARNTIFVESTAANGDVQLRAAAGSGQVRAIDSSGDEHFSVDYVNKRVNLYKPIVHRVYTVATLPAPSGTVPPGSRAMVSDANSTTFNSIVAGGGANTVPVFVDGAGNWRIG